MGGIESAHMVENSVKDTYGGTVQKHAYHAYLIVQHYPSTGKHTIDIYSTDKLAFRGEEPITIILGKSSASTFEEAQNTLIRIFLLKITELKK